MKVTDPPPSSHVTGGLRKFVFDNRTDVVVCSLLVMLTVAVYWPVAGFEFVNWDDPWYVTNNRLLESWHPSNLKEIATSVVVRNYAPLTIFSFLVDRTLWGEWAGGFHLTNLLLHLTNTVLVYFLVLQLIRQTSTDSSQEDSIRLLPQAQQCSRHLHLTRITAGLTAALFAVHPVQIETVAWVSSRKGLLSAAFILAASICWLRPSRQAKDELRGIGFFACALLSKAIAVVLPAIVLSYDLLILKRPFKQAFSRQVIPGFMAVWLLLMTMGAQTTELGGVRDHLHLSKFQILAVDAVIVWRYLSMLIWPNDLCVLYDPPTSGIAGIMLAACLAWGAVGMIAYRCRTHRPWAVLSLASFFLLLLPVLNLFPITTLMNDRYLYLPVIPAFALSAAAMSRLAMIAEKSIEMNRPAYLRGRLAMGALATTCLTAVVMYANMSADHLPVWKNDRVLWQHAVANVPQLPVVRIQYANALHADGRDREALAILAETLEKYAPDHADRDRILKKLDAWQ